MPVYHNGKLLAVIGITGAPDEVRKYAYLAERITILLIREKELDAFSRSQSEILKIAVGKACPLSHLHLCSSARTALRNIEGTEQSFVSFDDLTLELIISSADKTSREEFLRKTVSRLSEDDLKITEAYFSGDMSLADTAGKLFIHKNTLQYKLNHIHEKSGLNPRRFQDAVLLYLALRIRDVQDLS